LNKSRYWQCICCAQKYQKSHGTRNPAAHLVRIHSIKEDDPAKTKRLKQAQQSIQISMQVAAVAEVQRTREREREIQWIKEQNAQAVPPLSPESLEILYVSYLN